MNTDEILAQRELTARFLLANLKAFGNIEPPGFYGRPTLGAGKHIGSTSKANYLRIAAAMTKDSRKNPHYISQAQALAMNSIIHEDAKPVYLERWSGNKQVGYNIRLEPYYNVDDLTCYHEDVQKLQKNLPEHDREEDMAALETFLHAKDLVVAGRQSPSILDRSDPAYPKHLMDLAYQAATAAGLDRRSTAFFTQVAFQEYHITMPVGVNQPLFSPDDLSYFEEDTNRLFQSMNQACNFLRDYSIDLVLTKEEQAEVQQLAEHYFDTPQEEETVTVEPVSEEPAEKENPEEDKTTYILAETDAFPGLTVHYDFLDATIPMTDTEHYPYTDVTLTGEKAYEFLVRFNAKDKEMFRDHLQEDQGDGKCRIAISCNGINYNDGHTFRCDLGDLELHNAKSVAEALESRFTMSARYDLTEEGLQNALDYMKSSLHDGPIQTAEEIQNEARADIVEVASTMKDFVKEEEAYLAKHPELKAINEEDANLHLYLCRKEDYTEHLQSFSMGKAVDLSAGYHVFPSTFDFSTLCNPNIYKLNRIPAEFQTIRKDLPSSFVAFYSHRAPKYMVEKDKPKKVLLAIPPSTVEKLKNLSHLRVDVTTTKHNWKMGENEPPTISDKDSYYGLGAVSFLQSLSDEDREAYNTAVSTRYYNKGTHPILDVSVVRTDTEQVLSHVVSQKGMGAFNEKFSGSSFLGLPQDNENAKDLYEGVNEFIRFQPYRELSMITGKGYRVEGEFPTAKESMQTWKEHPEDYLPNVSDKKHIEPDKISKVWDSFTSFAELWASSFDISSPNNKALLSKAANAMVECGYPLESVKKVGKWAALRYGEATSDFLCRYAECTDLLELSHAVQNRAQGK